MKRIDLTNQRFNRLLVLESAPSRRDNSGRNRTYWLCKCDCGREIEVETSALRSKKTKSCGCLCGRIDHTGERFGRLIALKHLEGSKYLCKCDCGNETITSTTRLTSGMTQSCGCLQRDRASEASHKSLIGQRFGQLIVIKRVENNKFKHVCYECKCDCGGVTIVDATNLRNGNTTSCGCIKSKGESKINQWLQEHNIHFQAQYSYEPIILSSGRHPFFDFALLDDDNNPVAFIEYNGKQHYEYSGYGWDNEENYKNTVRRDIEKREQCQKYNIPLHEIPYWEFEKLDKVLASIIDLYIKI